MATDEALLELVGAAQSPPTLHLYAWEPPALSLGFTQPVAEVDRPALERNGWGLVRRPTGGRAILHTDELTYAVIAPKDHRLVEGGVMASYRRISGVLGAALQHLGLRPEVRRREQPGERERARPVCFEVPSAYELVFQGKKLVGSAQVRRRHAVLQHGTVPLAGDLARICLALSFPGEQEREAAAVRVRKRGATISELLGRQVTWDEAAEAMTAAFRDWLEGGLEKKGLSTNERARIAELAREKHQDRGWIERL